MSWPEGEGNATCSVIVCCYTEDRWQQLQQALCTVLEQASARPPSRCQVVVVVDHNDSLLARVRRRFPQIRVVPSDGPPGLSGARNTGVDLADGAVVVFLDDDAVPHPGWLALLLGVFADDTVLAVGGGADPAWATGRPVWWPAEFDWVIGCSYTGMPAHRAPIRNVMGCNMAVRRSVFDAGLRFPGELGRTTTSSGGAEETELCLRIRERWPTARILFEPGARVAHHVPEVRSSARYFVRRCFAEGRSKARLRRLVDSEEALSSEWEYTRRVLPRGVGRGVRDCLGGDTSGLARSAAIATGLGVTAAGYVFGGAS